MSGWRDHIELTTTSRGQNISAELADANKTEKIILRHRDQDESH